MENPAVTVTVTIIRPNTETEYWSDTAEGYYKTFQIMNVLESHAPNVEVVSTDVDLLTRTMVIFYNSVPVYDQSRAECLALEPTFIATRDEYYNSIGGTVTQDVVYA